LENLKSFRCCVGKYKKCFLYNRTYNSDVTRCGDRRNVTACEPQWGKKSRNARRNQFESNRHVRALNFFAFPWKLVLHKGEERIYSGLVGNSSQTLITFDSFRVSQSRCSRIQSGGQGIWTSSWNLHTVHRHKMRVFRVLHPGILCFGWLDW